MDHFISFAEYHMTANAFMTASRLHYIVLESLRHTIDRASQGKAMLPSLMKFLSQDLKNILQLESIEILRLHSEYSHMNLYNEDHYILMYPEYFSASDQNNG